MGTSAAGLTMLPSENPYLLLSTVVLITGVLACFNLRRRAMKTATVQRATKSYSFSVKHQGRGGYVEYQDSEHTVKMEIEILVGKPCFVIYTEGVDAAIRPLVVSRLKGWLKITGEEGNWDVA